MKMRQKSGIRGSDSEKMIRTIKWKTRRQYSADGKQDKKTSSGSYMHWRAIALEILSMLFYRNVGFD